MNSLHAQADPVKDSLLRLIAGAKEDSAGVELYIKTGNALESSNPAMAATFYQKAKSISEKINYKRGVTKSLIYYGSVTYLQGQYDSSIYYEQQALELSKINRDTLYMGICLMNMGISAQQVGDNEQALEFLLEGQRLIESTTDINIKNIRLQMLIAVQTIYSGRVEYDKSIAYGEKALALADELKDEVNKPYTLLNLSAAWREKKQLEKAEQFANEGMQLAAKTGDKRLEAAGILAVISVWDKQGLYQKMLPYAQRALKLSRESTAADMEIIALNAVGVCYLQLKDFETAERFANEALEMSRKQQVKGEETNALRLLSRIAYANGNLENGARYEEMAKEIQDSYVQEIISSKSANLEKKYETEKKSKEIAQLKSDQKIKSLWNYILAGAAATLLIISLLSYRTYKQKQKLQQQQIAELEKEKQLLAAEAVLKGQEEERTRLAKDLHDGLGGMLSGIKYSFNTMKENLVLTPDNALAFERSMDMLDSSIKELRLVAHNLMPESLVKFGLDTALKDFCGNITASGALKVTYHSFGMEAFKTDAGKEIIVYRIVQELINNSIKHAAATEAIVQLELQNNQLQITVEDDGKGFDVNSLNAARGIGWGNIKNRAEYLKAKLNVNSQQGKGTSVHMVLDV
ncbi:MAG: tetratricopeptide repeat protein [Chitinophagaceae bacterium]|nr:tetratricopeptide repeat protein [Chitinophagaceae bacterium]